MHARRVPAEVVRALAEEARRVERTMDFVVTSVLRFWYEDMMAADEAKKKRRLRGAGVGGTRVG